MQAIRGSLTFLNLTVLAILVNVAVLTSIFSMLANPDGNDGFWSSGWLQNFSTEMFGAVITFALFGLVVGAYQREKDAESLTQLRQAITDTVTAEIQRVQQAAATDEAQRREIAKEAEIEQEKERLILQMGSQTPDGFAVEAARQLAARGWLQDGSVQGAFLPKANLKGADLRQANLKGTTLAQANLQGATLENPNYGAAQFNAKTTLPDGTMYDPEKPMWEQLARFVDLGHPDFWRSDELTSPAHRERG